MAKNAKAREHPVVEQWTISEIQVAGFKSISEEQRIEIRPLTILAGANSSGKSSMMQPLAIGTFRVSAQRSCHRIRTKPAREH